MIVVKIELWPLGSEKRAREIGRMYIANNGESLENPKRGTYEVAVSRKGLQEYVPGKTFSSRATRTGVVKDFPRKSYSVWRLISRAILSCFPEENKK